MQYAYRLPNFLLVPFGFLVTLWWCYRCWFLPSFHVAEYNWDILFLANHRGPKGDWVRLAVFHHLGSLKFSIVECIRRKFANTFVLKYKSTSPNVRDNLILMRRRLTGKGCCPSIAVNVNPPFPNSMWLILFSETHYQMKYEGTSLKGEDWSPVSHIHDKLFSCQLNHRNPIP